MNTNFVVNKNSVNTALQTVQEKIKVWQEIFPSLKFDAQGRAILKNNDISLNTVSRTDINNILIDDEDFLTAFNNTLHQCGYCYVMLDGNHTNVYSISMYISIDTLLSGYFHFQKISDGKYLKMKVTTFLDKVNQNWEKLPIGLEYVQTKKQLKTLRNAGHGYENLAVIQLTEKCKELQKNNLYTNYNNLLNSLSKTPIIISVNPLDLLNSSGDNNTSLTGFTSCWGNSLTQLDDGIHYKADRCYSSPLAQTIIGSLSFRALLYQGNGKTLQVPETDFFLTGYKIRGHVNITVDKKIHIEKIYPCNDSAYVDKIESILKSNGLETTSENDNNTLMLMSNADYELIADYIDTRDAQELFFDRSYIDNDNNKFYTMSNLRCDQHYTTGDFYPDYNSQKCFHCDNEVEDNIHTIYENDIYCEECFNELFTTCDDCDRTVSIENVHCVSDRCICRFCYDNNYATCSDCRDGFSNDDITDIDGHCVCDDCRDNDYIVCEVCEEYTHFNNITDIDNKSVCSDCISDNYTHCHECDTYHKDDTVCEVCAACEDANEDTDSELLTACNC